MLFWQPGWFLPALGHQQWPGFALPNLEELLAWREKDLVWKGQYRPPSPRTRIQSSYAWKVCRPDPAWPHLPARSSSGTLTPPSGPCRSGRMSPSEVAEPAPLLVGSESWTLVQRYYRYRILLSRQLEGSIPQWWYSKVRRRNWFQTWW